MKIWLDVIAKNCKRCGAWRRLVDYKPFSSGHLSGVCWLCEKMSDRKRALARYYAKHEVNKTKQRNRARARRRDAGVPERGSYDVERVAPADRKVDLILRFGPRP